MTAERLKSCRHWRTGWSTRGARNECWPNSRQSWATGKWNQRNNQIEEICTCTILTLFAREINKREMLEEVSGTCKKCGLEQNAAPVASLTTAGPKAHWVELVGIIKENFLQKEKQLHKHILHFPNDFSHHRVNPFKDPLINQNNNHWCQKEVLWSLFWPKRRSYCDLGLADTLADLTEGAN